MESIQNINALPVPDETLEARDFHPLVNQTWQPLLDDTAIDVYEEDIAKEPSSSNV